MVNVFLRGFCSMKILPLHNYSVNRSFTSGKSPLHQDGEKKDNNASLNRGKIIGTVAAGAVLAGVILSILNHKKVKTSCTNSQELPQTPEITEYVKKLSESLSKYLNKKIEPEQLSSVMSGEELLKELKTMTKENYAATPENIKNGAFIADLHSHSNFSDGKGEVKDILSNVAQYADYLNKKNGKKFIFALTDHDGVEGVKEALKIISETPEKYKNVKFVTGSEISYIIKSNKTENPYETSELLVYGFNPFDNKVNDFFNNIQLKRKRLAEEYIRDLNQKFGYANFTYEEFARTYLNKNQFMMMNNQWKVQDYGQTKNAVAGLAGFQNRNKEELYSEIMKKTSGRKQRLCDLREKKLVPQNFGEDSNILQICRSKYTPHNSDNCIDFAGENNINDILPVFKDEKNAFGAFAHPYYATERTTEAEKVLSNIVKNSNGFIKATESYHQAYKPSVRLEEVEKFNNFIVSRNKLLELGGRDNHNSLWLDFITMD